MRISRLTLVAAAVAATVATISDAKARGRRSGFFFVSTGSRASAPVVSTENEGALNAARVSKAADTSNVFRPRNGSATVPAPEATPAAKAIVSTKVAAAEWCPTHRVVGSGAGFCDLNPHPIR